MTLATTSKNPYVASMAGGNVKWLLWDGEALDGAAKGDKPLCLCITNNGSRWSHAMKSSFDDAEAAKLLNEDFIPVLADCDDVPQLTLAARALAQTMLGHSGWPLMVFMTPQKKPFFASSYMPLESKDPRMPGLLDVLRRVKWLWLMKRSDVDSAAESTAQQLAENLLPYSEDLRDGLAERAAQALLASGDKQWGGFGDKPKFIQGPKLALTAWLCRSDNTLRPFLDNSLSALASGAIYDHLSGGFHDYCYDNRWTQPCLGRHSAQTVAALWAFVEGFELFQSPAYWHVADDTIWALIFGYDRGDGLIRTGDDLSCGKVLDSYYLWSKKEIDAILGSYAKDFCAAYGVSELGNFKDTLTGSYNGSNALCLSGLASLDDRPGRDMTELWDQLSADRARLASARLERKAPAVEDRVSVRTNGIFAALLARASRIMNRPAYAEQTEKILLALLQKGLDEQGGLCHMIYGDELQGSASLDDVAAVIWAHLELLRSTNSPQWLAGACAWAETADEVFGSSGAMALTGPETLSIVPAWDGGDDHLPSGNGLMVNNLVTLYLQTGEKCWLDRARTMVNAFGGALNNYPESCAALTLGALRLQAAEKR